MKTLLTIAGFDPSSGAGITADLAVFSAHLYFGMSAATAWTVQSTRGVKAVHPVETPALQEMLQCLTEDLPPDGVKVGMLATAGNVDAVAAYLETLRTGSWRPPIVLDPVIRSSSGRELLDPNGLHALRDRLLPLVEWITPNRSELSLLSGLPVATESDIYLAARGLQHTFRRLGIAATGGDEDASDLVLAPDADPIWLRAPKIDSSATHGTGCAFSSALLCGLVDGRDGLAAARSAKEYVREAIRTAVPLGHGKGPMNLLWPLRTSGPLPPG